MGNEMLVVFVERAGVPSPAGALIGFQPGDSRLNLRVIGRYSCLSQYVHDEPGAISVGRGNILRRPIGALPIAQRRQVPPALRVLGRK